MIKAAVGTGVIVALWFVATIGVRVAYADRILPGSTMAGLALAHVPMRRLGNWLPAL